jgi:hypothetical protein
MTTADDLGSNVPDITKSAGKAKPRKRRAKVASTMRIKPDRVKIILEENENIPPTGQFFGLNGTGYIIRPGVEVEVPRGIISILNDAVMSVPVVDFTNTVVSYKDKLRFPYRFVGMDY